MKQIFIKTLILNYFNLKQHIYLKRNTFNLIISKIFGEFNFDNWGQ